MRSRKVQGQPRVKTILCRTLGGETIVATAPAVPARADRLRYGRNALAGGLIRYEAPRRTGLGNSGSVSPTRPPEQVQRKALFHHEMCSLGDVQIHS